MTIEDLTDYDEFDSDSIIYAPIIPMSITTHQLDAEDRWEVYDETIGRRFWDSLGREIECGDILLWKSGGFFNYFLSYGIVLSIFRETPYRVLVLNNNKNKVTLWSTSDKTILAKHNNYDIIPDRYKDIWNI